MSKSLPQSCSISFSASEIRQAGGPAHGIEHGAFCVGCCWVLMALLFVGGIMNVLWIAVLATVVLLEKLAPRGPWFARVTGIVLLAWGTATLAA